ncbi:hypothetical protein K7432_014651 [Basidiobolus ranarum]|uniref:C2H2-type domain-containing protein n=2 Tax=Basidiobolus TaxID=4859 RepID=A0ABR2VQ70_9FUNG
MNDVANLSATTPVSANFSNIQSPGFPVWSYSSPISPVFPSGSNDVFFNNSMMNTSNSLAIDPIYTRMHFTTTIPCHMDSDLEKIDPDVPIHPENFASDVSSSIKPSFLLQGASFVNESPSPQLVPDQLSPTFSSALMTPTTENFPNMLYVPWEVGLMDPQCGLIDFSTPQTPTKFEMPGLTDMPLSATQLSFNPNPALNILNSPTADNFQSSNTNVSNVSQVYTCTYPNCKKTFSCIYNLRSHYRIHSTERPFKCDSCQQSFSRNHDLKRHQKIHLGIKPYRCTKCDRTFGRLDALKRHTLVKRCAERASKEKLPHSTGTYIAPGRATASIESGNDQAEASISA